MVAQHHFNLWPKSRFSPLPNLRDRSDIRLPGLGLLCRLAEGLVLCNAVTIHENANNSSIVFQSHWHNHDQATVAILKVVDNKYISRVSEIFVNILQFCYNKCS